MSRKHLLFALIGFSTVFGGLIPAPSFARDDSPEIVSIDHYIPHTSTAPATQGDPVTLYVRERAQADLVQRSPSLTGKVVLFVHGSALGSTGAFDAPYQDYSWMAYLAQGGFDAFGLDLTGFGFSTRPAPMNEPCNLDPAQQALPIPSVLPQNCPPGYASQVTTLRSDWDDIDAAVNYLRALRHVDRVDLVGWSYGGSTAGGYAALHPDKVNRLVFLSPAYDRDHPNASAPETAAVGVPMFLQAQDGVPSFWDPQIQCSDQLDAGCSELGTWRAAGAVVSEVVLESLNRGKSPGAHTGGRR